jgi:DNA-binding LacI/PurR family transcriptional regulator
MTPIGRRILTALAKELSKFEPGDILPTDAELMRAIGAPNRHAILAAMKELEAKGIVTRTKGGKTYYNGPVTPVSPSNGNYGLLRAERGDPFFAKLSREVSKAVAAAKGELVEFLVPPDPKDGDIQKIANDVVERRCRGLFFIPLEFSVTAKVDNHKLAAALEGHVSRIVLLDRDLGPFGTRSNYNLVATDNLAAGYLLASFFLKAERRIAFVAQAGAAQTIEQRIAGVRAALPQHENALPNWLFRWKKEDRGFVVRLATTGPDVVICGSDNTLKELRAVWPKNRPVEFAGFDHVEAIDPPVHTMVQSCQAMAEVGWHVMHDACATPRLILLKPRFLPKDAPDYPDLE